MVQDYSININENFENHFTTEQKEMLHSIFKFSKAKVSKKTIGLWLSLLDGNELNNTMSIVTASMFQKMKSTDPETYKSVNIEKRYDVDHASCIILACLHLYTIETGKNLSISADKEGEVFQRLIFNFTNAVVFEVGKRKGFLKPRQNKLTEDFTAPELTKLGQAAVEDKDLALLLLRDIK